VLHALKLAMKVGQRRNKRRAADAVDDAPLRGSNVMYALLDPAGEWLACVTVLQSEPMLAMQLAHSKDVLAQVQDLLSIGAATCGMDWRLSVYMRVLHGATDIQKCVPHGG
jgi:hypothetical protein